MLSRLQQPCAPSQISEMSIQNMGENRHRRNELEDMKKGLEYLYEFKEKLSKLHPHVLESIEQMLQYRTRY